MRKLFDLARANAGKGAGLRSEVDGDTATVYVYDVIDSLWGVSAADFARELRAITAPNILLRVNSPGGDVFEARAMMTAIAEHPSTFTAKIDGLAASAATALTLACARVEIADGGFYMIHKAWTFAMGNADDMAATAKLLEKIDDVLVDGYAGKSGKPKDEILALMKAETWFNAQEAVDAGFAEAIMETSAKGQAKAFNVAAYANAPTALTEPEPEDDQTRQRMLARLGLYERSA
ncbi:peptidase S14 [Altererythrobacter sp. B11]|uniref:head maturation protease, ClpP-related n=1 Tax=Altererythrobacter sp. B11 TaxID=2060312 RepID=UPI000DC6E8D4|nr:head maturation protease, ClpP-related [Altererythrobacter sp. B11]BBC72914.1 peptidase S14 [Altererythrobacter sp. B11]